MSKAVSFKPLPYASQKTPWLVNVPARFTNSGKRERRFFKKKSEAEEFARQQRIRVQNYGASATALPAGRVEEASIAFERLAPHGLNLTQVVDDFLARRASEAKSVTLKHAFQSFEAHKPTRRSPAYKNQLASTLRRFSSVEDTLVASITKGEIEAALAGAPPSARNAFLRVLSAVLNYGIKREWTDMNPVKKVDRAEVARGDIEVLSLKEARGLLSACVELDPALLPYHALGLFAGIRPKELNRMTWEHIHMKDREIKLSPEVTKTRSGRTITMEPVLVRWLGYHVKVGGANVGEIAPQKNQRKRLDRIREKAGAVPWIQDVMRHSFASHWLKNFEDKDRLLGFMGHATDAMLLEHYLRAVDRNTAKQYWQIGPPKAPKKTVRKRAA
jgi:integrase/recombinase XerD